MPRGMTRFTEYSETINYVLILSHSTSFCREADRFYDGDLFVDAGESDGVLGIENTAAQAHPLRSRDNIYEFKDTKPVKSIQDTNSIRSPSSLAITDKTTTRSGSQTSLRSGAMSLKESPGTPTGKENNNFEKNHNKFSEKVEPNPRGKYDDSRNLLSSYDKSREMASSPVDTKSITSSVTPVPTARKTLKSSKTHLIEGVPQTEV